jgi:hypothetical protein
MMLSESKGSEEEEEDVEEVEGDVEWEAEGVAKGGRRSCPTFSPMHVVGCRWSLAWIASQLGCPPFDLRYATTGHRVELPFLGKF